MPSRQNLSLLSTSKSFRISFWNLICDLFSASDELDTIVQGKDKELKKKETEMQLLKVKMAGLQTKLENSLAENKELVSICDQLMESK